MAKDNQFSRIVSVFQDQYLPEKGIVLAGYSALIGAYSLKVPLPDILCAISKKHKKYQKDRWMMFTPRHVPRGSLFGQIVFALKYEGVNLAVLKALFSTISLEEIVKIIKLEPTGSYSRRLWFLYEWLQGVQLDLPDAKKGNFIDALDSKLQYPGPTRPSKRHRVRNNLPGIPGFCPTIRKTKAIDKFIAMHLDEQAKNNLGSIHPDILMRAAAFMLLKDSRASYAIEGETPPQIRAQRLSKVIGQAGLHELSCEEFLRLQEMIISDFRFTHRGYRSADSFVGEHERATGLPIPEHISARAKDLQELIDGLLSVNSLLKDSEFDAVLAAAVISSGFIFIHPFEDGNGRLHRYLIHHVLAYKNFTSNGMVFPVSTVILDRIEEYRKVLESCSRPRLQFIKWRATEKGDIDVLNETADLYRYFDATKQAEFLYECIRETIEKILPEEVNYLKKYDDMKYFVANYLDLPDRLIDLLIRFLVQENGKLSKRARREEFSSLTSQEVETLEKRFAEIF